MNSIVNLKNTIDDVLLVFTKRGKSVTLDTLKVAIERITNKSKSENISRSVLSFNPDDSSLTICNTTIHVKMENRNVKASQITKKEED